MTAEYDDRHYGQPGPLERRFLEIAADLFCILEHDGPMAWFNLSWLSLLGWSRSELQGMRSEDLIHVADRPDWRDTMAGLRDRGGSAALRVRVCRRDGTWVWFECRAVRDADGRLHAALRDISAQVQLEAWKAERARLAMLAEQAAQLGWWYVHRAGGRVDWSEELSRQCGFAPPSEGSSLECTLRFCHPDDRPEIERYLRRAFENRMDFSINARLIRPDATLRPVAVKGRCDCDETGAIRGVLCLLDGAAARDGLARLRLTEEKFAKVFNSSPDAIAISLLADGRYIDVNSAFERIIGYARDEAIGRSSPDLGIWVDPEERRHLLQRLADRGRVEDFEVRLRRKSGQIITCLVSCQPIEIDGEACMLSIARDITPRKAMERQIREALAEQELIFETALVGIAFVKDRRFVRVNRRMTEMFGYGREEMIAALTRLIYPNDESYEQLGREAYGAEGPVQNYCGEMLLQHKDGRGLWCSMLGRAIDSQNAGQGWIWIFEDISAARLAQIELQKVLRAVEQSPTAILITDTDGNIEYVNPRFCETTGYTAAEVIGRNPRLLKSGITPDRLYAELWQTIASGRIWRGEILNRKKNGELFWEDASISPVRDADGRVTHYVSVKENVTDRKRVEEELLAAKDQAEVANRAKSQFLANMSHELRTPLNAIIGFSEIIKDRTFGPNAVDRYCEYAADVHYSGLHLLNLVTDILDIAKIEAGKLEIEPEWLDLRLLVDGCVRLLKTAAEEKGLRIEIHRFVELPQLYADERALKQIIFNLVSNAIKFTGRGGRVALEACRTAAGAVEIRVSDTGVGIPEEDIERVLQPFVQVDNSYGRARGGTGLGLALVKGLVELHCGTLHIDSRVGQGTIVTVTFPPLPDADAERSESSQGR